MNLHHLNYQYESPKNIRSIFKEIRNFIRDSNSVKNMDKDVEGGR